MDKPKTPDEKAYPSDIDRVAPDQRRYGWVMLSLLWLLNVAFSLIVRAIAPLVTPIVRDLHLSYTQMGFILGSWQLTYIGVAIIAGTIIDRWSVRKSLLAGTLFFSVLCLIFAALTLLLKTRPGDGNPSAMAG
jgi:MFS family permease